MVVVHAEENRQFPPQTRGELSPAVGHDGGRDAESGHPVVQESTGAGVGSDGGERDGLHPPGESVDHCEEIGLAFRFWERAHQVEVDGHKTGVWQGDGHQGRLGVAGHLRTLAGGTGPAENLDLLGHETPDKSPL